MSKVLSALSPPKDWKTSILSNELNKTAVVGLVIVVALATGLAALRLTSVTDWGDDWAGYLMQTRALVESSISETIVHNSFTILNSPPPLGPMAYPWGYPILLVPIYIFFGANLLALKTVGLLAFTLSLPVVYLLFQHRLSPVVLLLVVAALGLNAEVAVMTDRLISDMPFLFFNLLGLLAIERFVVAQRRLAPTPLTGLVLGVSIFLASAIRINGLLLLAVLAVGQLMGFLESGPARAHWRRDWRAIILPYTVFGILYAGLMLALPDGGLSQTISAQAPRWLSLSDMAAYYLNLPAELFLPSQFRFLIYGATLPFVIAGIVRNFRTDLHLIVFCGLTILLLVALPFFQGLRYLFPVIPFYFYFMAQGLSIGWNLPEKWRWVNPTVTQVCLVGIVGYFALVSIRTTTASLAGEIHHDGPADRDGLSLLEFVRKRTEPQDIIVFFKPRAMWLLTGRDSYLAVDCGKLGQADYVVINNLIAGGQQVPPARIPFCYSGVIVFSNPTFTVYRRIGGSY